MSLSWVLSIVLTALLIAGIGFTQYRPRSSSGASVSDSAFAKGADGRARDGSNPNSKRPEDAEIRRQFLDAVDTFDSAVVRLDSALVRLSIGGSPDQARAEFRQARYAYKAIEPLVERYAPVAALTINGPAIDKPNEDSPTLAIPPNGFQVIEVSLYPRVLREEIPAMRQEVAVLRVGAKRIRELVQYTSFTDEQLFDAVRVHMGRVMTLGLAGFDATLSQDALAEAAASIRGVRGMLSRFEAIARQRDASAWAALDQTLTRVLYMLDTARSFNDFDRLTFIVSGATPLVTALDRVRATLGIPAMTDRRTWKPSALTVFEPGAFDLSTYAPPYAQSTSREIVDLGCALFADPLLSEHTERSCASCHHPTRAFTDGLPKSALSHSNLPVPSGNTNIRNTPTLLGAAYQSSLFADQRVAYLEDQVTEVLANPAEMGGGAAAAADRIQRVVRYQAAFARAFGAHPANAEPQREVNELRLRMALAAYMLSLIHI